MGQDPLWGTSSQITRVPTPCGAAEEPGGLLDLRKSGGWSRFYKRVHCTDSRVRCVRHLPGSHPRDRGPRAGKSVRRFSDLCQGWAFGRARVLSRSAIDRSSRYWYRVYAGSVLYIVSFLLELSHVPSLSPLSLCDDYVSESPWLSFKSLEVKVIPCCVPSFVDAIPSTICAPCEELWPFNGNPSWLPAQVRTMNSRYIGDAVPGVCAQYSVKY